MRILHAVINKRSEDIIKNMMIDDLNGVVCFIPSIVVGESMAIMSSNAVWVRYRTTPIVSISIDANTGVYSVHTEDVSYEILDLETAQRQVSSICCMSRITSSITGISMIRFISPMMNPSAPSPAIME